MTVLVLEAMPVNAVFLSVLSVDIVAEHPEFWDAISYDERLNFLGIEGNLNMSRYVCKMLQPEVIPFVQGIPGAIFSQDNALPHVAKTVRDFLSAQ